MSNNKNNLLPDYLDVSSDEEKRINRNEEKRNESPKENIISKSKKYKDEDDEDKSYDSYKNNYYIKRNRYEDKYYRHNRYYKSRSNSTSRSRSSRSINKNRNSKYKYKDNSINRRESRSRNSRHRYKDNSINRRESRSRNRYSDKSRSRYKYKRKYRYKSRSGSKNRSRSRSRSSRYRNYYYKRSISRSYKRNQSRSKDKSRNKDYKEYKKQDYAKNNIDANADINKEKEIKDKEEYIDKNEMKKKEVNQYNNKYNNNKIDKWTDGTAKDDFKSIKIEKYDKNKPKKYIENTSKEISQLKKDLNNEKNENNDNEKKEEIIEKEKPNFEPSGILQKDLQEQYNNSMNNKISINYKPPNDSIIPEDIWFLFKFLKEKNEASQTYKLVGKEFFLLGKDNRICDIHIKQKNISRQHAVIQFRKILKDNKDSFILPYLIDLNSTNGTFLNGEKIDNSKYYELRDKDNLNFGDKKIDFVLMKMKWKDLYNN